MTSTVNRKISSSFLKGNWRKSRTTWKGRDQALVEFEKRNDLAILKAQLSAKQSALNDYLTMNEFLVLLQQNVNDLQDQLARRLFYLPSNLGDDLARTDASGQRFKHPGK